MQVLGKRAYDACGAGLLYLVLCGQEQRPASHKEYTNHDLVHRHRDVQSFARGETLIECQNLTYKLDPRKKS